MRENKILNLCKIGKNIVIKEGETKMKKVISLILTATMSVGMLASSGSFVYAGGDDADESKNESVVETMVQTEENVEKVLDTSTNEDKPDNSDIKTAKETEDKKETKAGFASGVLAGVAAGTSVVTGLVGVDTVRNAATSVAGAATSYASSVYGTAASAASSAYSTVAGAATYASSAYGAAASAASSAYNTVAGAVAPYASSAYGAAASAANSAYSTVAGAVAPYVSSAYGAAANAANSAYSTVAGAVAPYASSAYGTAANAANSAYSTVAGAVAPYASSAYGAVAGATSSAYSRAAGFVAPYVSSAYGATTSVVSSAMEGAANLVKAHPQLAAAVGGVAAGLVIGGVTAWGVKAIYNYMHREEPADIEPEELVVGESVEKSMVENAEGLVDSDDTQDDEDDFVDAKETFDVEESVCPKKVETKPGFFSRVGSGICSAASNVANAVSSTYDVAKKVVFKTSSACVTAVGAISKTTDVGMELAATVFAGLGGYGLATTGSLIATYAYNHPTFATIATAAGLVAVYGANKVCDYYCDIKNEEHNWEKGSELPEFKRKKDNARFVENIINPVMIGVTVVGGGVGLFLSPQETVQIATPLISKYIVKNRLDKHFDKSFANTIISHAVGIGVALYTNPYYLLAGSLSPISPILTWTITKATYLTRYWLGDSK